MTNNETKYVSELAEERRLLQVQLAESKQRDATLTLERDAALNALEIARGGLRKLLYACEPFAAKIREDLLEQACVILNCIDLTAALADRDRVIRENERSKIADWIQSNVLWFDIERFRREFGIELKQEAE